MNKLIIKREVFVDPMGRQGVDSKDTCVFWSFVTPDFVFFSLIFNFHEIFAFIQNIHSFWSLWQYAVHIFETKIDSKKAAVISFNTIKLWFVSFNFFRNYSRYWRHLWDYRYGNCYTFNGGVDDSGESQRVLNSHITGPTGGNVLIWVVITTGVIVVVGP